MKTLFHTARQYRDLFLILVERNIKIRYKNSALGFFWTLLGPLFLIAIYATFLWVLRFGIHLPVLVTGIIVWQFLAMCLGDSLHAVVGNANLVTKAAFPRFILPASMVAANFVNFVLSAVVLAVYLLVVGERATAWPALPLVILTHGALCLGVSLLVATANVFFRDTEHILSVVMLAWFFMTPIIYPMEMVGEHFAPGSLVHSLYFLNPMTGIVSAYRSILLSAEVMPLALTGLSFGVAWAVLVAGVIVFRRAQPRFGDEL